MSSEYLKKSKAPAGFAMSRGWHWIRQICSAEHFLQFINEPFCHRMVNILARGLGELFESEPVSNHLRQVDLSRLQDFRGLVPSAPQPSPEDPSDVGVFEDNPVGNVDSSPRSSSTPGRGHQSDWNRRQVQSVRP